MPDRRASRVVIIDDHPLVSEPIATRLRDAGFDVLAPMTTVEAIDWTTTPDVAVCDLRLLPGMSLGTAIEFLVRRGCRVLAISGVATPDQVLDAIRHGALGFLAKSAPPEDFVPAVAAVARGEHYISPHLGGYLLEDAKRRPLPAGEIGPAEMDLLRAFAQGDHRDEIMTEKGLAEETLAEMTARIFDAARGRRSRREYRPTEREAEAMRLIGCGGLSHQETARTMGIGRDRVSELLENVRDKYLACHPDESRNTSPSAAAIRWAHELGLC